CGIVPRQDLRARGMRDWVRTRLTVGVADQHGEFVHDLREVLRVPQDATPCLRPPLSIAARSKRRLKVAPERATMGPNAAGTRRCTWPWIPWALSWRCLSLPPMSKTGATSIHWPKKCKQ